MLMIQKTDPCWISNVSSKRSAVDNGIAVLAGLPFLANTAFLSTLSTAFCKNGTSHDEHMGLCTFQGHS